MSGTPLGEFLRARREKLQPQDVGLPEHGRRRVTGPRREEVAVLAGMSSDYYMRLEQGRESSPSPQVVEAVARALRLDAAATEHLWMLVQPPEARVWRRSRTNAVHGIRSLITRQGDESQQNSRPRIDAVTIGYGWPSVLSEPAVATWSPLSEIRGRRPSGLRTHRRTRGVP